MKFPTYDTLPRDNRHVTAMIQGIAQRERHVSRESAALAPCFASSRRLGELCVRLTQPKFANRHAARGIIQKERSTTKLQGMPRTLLDMIFFQSSPTAIARYQEELHAGVIDEIRRAYKRPHAQVDTGRMTELVSVAQITRLAHPQVLAYSALPHHEQDRNIAQHYDIGASFDKGDSLATHMLQVKKFCLGACAEPELQRQRKKAVKKSLRRYDQSIQMVSGCCELGITDNGQDFMDPTLPVLLVAEFYDRATSDEIAELDAGSEKLITDITSDLLPRGTAPGSRRVINLADPIAYISQSVAV